MNQQIHDDAVRKRLGLQPIEKQLTTTAIHRLIMLCRSAGATLVQLGDMFTLTYQNTTRTLSNRLDIERMILLLEMENANC